MLKEGVLLINKPIGISSNKAVQIVKKIYDCKKVGHFGTLDPMAQGLLVVALGRATRFFDFYMNQKKEYSGEFFFGCNTTTYDSEGEIVGEKKEIDLNKVDLKALKNKFMGKMMQTPPIYSAKKVKGKALYDYARSNMADKVSIKPCSVEIYDLDLEIRSHNTLFFKVKTSPGTYIRSLAHDMGEWLGGGAYLKSLLRLSSGEFSLSKAITIEKLESLSEEERDSKVIPLEELLSSYSTLYIKDERVKDILNGQVFYDRDVVEHKNQGASEIFRVFCAENKKLLALSKLEPLTFQYKPFIVFN